MTAWGSSAAIPPRRATRSVPFMPMPITSHARTSSLRSSGLHHHQGPYRAAYARPGAHAFPRSRRSGWYDSDSASLALQSGLAPEVDGIAIASDSATGIRPSTRWRMVLSTTRAFDSPAPTWPFRCDASICAMGERNHHPSADARRADCTMPSHGPMINRLLGGLR